MKLEDWKIDNSAGRPILTYKDCSVIEAEDAEFVMRAVKAALSPVTDDTVEKACLAYWGEKNMNSMFKGKTREGVISSMRAALEATQVKS